ncbi:MAG: hypothetical protein JEZ09_16005 [Salinivirgaceae bacterium]|nr:hypothetical protein [Salinivirgaceae bacterium]
MMKSIITLVGIFLGSILFAQEDILINIPEKIKAGNEFLLVVNIPANHMKGISRLQLVLPNGFNATAKETMNSDFKFEDQKAQFLWLNYPVDEELEVTLGVTVAPTIEGYFVIKGMANWLQNNEPLRSNIYPQVITVLAGDKSEDELLSNVEKTKFSYEQFSSEGVACIRQVPYEENGEIIVNILISKGDFNKYGKLQEKIPVGYEVENVKSHNAIFVYNSKQKLVKYMWMNMPQKPKFIVTYKLKPTAEIDESNPFLIYGTFYYADNNKTIPVDIQERGIELSEE